MTEYNEQEILRYEDLKMLILEHCGNENPGIFIEYLGKCVEFEVYIDDDSDIIFRI